MIRATIFIALTIALGACGAGAPALPPAQAPRPPTPVVVTEASYPDVLRAFARLGPQAPEREALRARLVDHLLARADSAISADRYDDVVTHLSQIAELYSPREWGERMFPVGLSRVARYLVAKGSPRGDEARVLAGRKILAQLAPDDAQAAGEYEKLSRWGFEARADMSGPLERFVGLVEVWEEHARLTPLPEVQTTLVRLYVERRDALVRLFQSSQEQVPLSASVFQSVQRTAFNVAAVYLRHGDVTQALTQVRALGSTGGIEDRLAEFLGTAREEGAEGAGALLDISRVYLEVGRSDVSRALCLWGLRVHEDDARFPTCLARIAATESDYGGALAWYAEAISLIPEERALYDEILEVLGSLIEQGLLHTDPTSTRVLSRRATEILQERMRRWPDSAPPVSPEDLYRAIALAEMNSGNAKQAEDYLRQSVASRPTPASLQQLGLLFERMGRPADAAERYGEALELLSGAGAEVERQRAELLEDLADAQRAAGQGDEAKQNYARALELLSAHVKGLKGRRAGLTELRRGVVLGRLLRAAEARDAFRRAMDAAPSVREVYATVLAYLAVNDPDPAFASEVFRTAQNQVGLEPEWKVYFALWLRLVAAQSGAPLPEINDVFESFSDGDGWWGKLASFGAGKLDYQGLLDVAKNLGERAEAHFYEGARLLAAGDQASAFALFAKVLDTQMVNFYEFMMAQELLARGKPAGAREQAAAR